MTTTTHADLPIAGAPAVRRTGRWIDDWRPEDPGFWDEAGRKVARRNLGFSVWLIWSPGWPCLAEVLMRRSCP